MPLVPFHRLFWVWFECGRGHRGPMIPYCPGAPGSCQSTPGQKYRVARTVCLSTQIQ
ncbi:unnamed protein product [Staurois parvus]|uniref:Uncharacterized protein n=1 Tax=Staurois parvus TaxID=386267 RepID=A0ABN9EYB9_9NEOB|nr:unnamed protein product [Staurois parvus]